MNWLFQLDSTYPVAHAIAVVALVCMAGMTLAERESHRNLVERPAVCHSFRTSVLSENLNFLQSLLGDYRALFLEQTQRDSCDAILC